MKNLIAVGFYLVSCCLMQVCFAQSAPARMAWYQPVDVPSNNISLSVIYDGEVSTLTGQQHSYYLTWEDTIGTKKGYSQQNRPYELHVVVRDRDTIVGRYTGRSYPSTTCYFVTNAKQVEVFFWLDINLWYEPPWTWKGEEHRAQEGPPLTTKEMLQEMSLVEKFWQRQEYAPIHIRMDRSPMNIVDGYDHQQVMLHPNPDIVGLDYINKGAMYPDNMPHYGPMYEQVMSLSRYQLDMATGRIKKGQQWIRWKGIRKCCGMEFRIVDPHLLYTDQNGEQYSGKALIRHRKLDPGLFSTDQFQMLEDCLPY